MDTVSDVSKLYGVNLKSLTCPKVIQLWRIRK